MVISSKQGTSFATIATWVKAWACMCAQLCPVLFDPMDHSLPGSPVRGIFFRQVYWNALPFPLPGDLPNWGIRPRSPVSSASSGNSLPLSHLGKHETIIESFYLSCSTYLRPGRSPWLMKEIKYFTCMFLFSLFLEACGDPPRFDTMRLQGAPKPSYRPGECVQYECRLGFKPKVPTLPRSAVCQDNNTWSSLQDACVGNKQTKMFYSTGFTHILVCLFHYFSDYFIMWI